MPGSAHNSSLQLTTRFLWLLMAAAALIIAVVACVGPRTSEPKPTLSTVQPPNNVNTHSPEPGIATTPVNIVSPEPKREIGEEDVADEQAGSPTNSSTASPDLEEVNEAEDFQPKHVVEMVVDCVPPEAFWNVSLKERILEADVVARVRLLSSSGDGNSKAYFSPNEIIMAPSVALDFRFRVLEYLKGEGANELVAVVSGNTYRTESDVRAVLPTIVADRDSRWDDVDAVVFLRDFIDLLPSIQRQGRYFMGQVDHCRLDEYSIASRLSKRWLPAVSVPGSDVSGDQQLFLMDSPWDSSTTPTITLGALKTRIAEVEEEINAGDGSEEYKACIRYKYIVENDIRKRAVKTGSVTDSVDWTMDSGLPAGSIVNVQGFPSGYPPDKTGKHWLDGPNVDLFSVETFDFTPYDGTGDGVEDRLGYRVRIATARPLPAGEYRFFRNHLIPERLICEALSDLERTEKETVVRVTAPAGTVHEAFFDPVPTGSAVGADSTAGVLEPAGFSVGRTATTITGLEWQNGSVVLTLDPYVSLAGRELELIDLDGSVALELGADTAVIDDKGGTLTWTVTGQPWEDGDLLMLRIAEVDPETHQ